MALRKCFLVTVLVLFSVVCFGAGHPAPGCLPKYEKFSLSESGFDFDELVFIKRYTYQSSHFYTDFIDGCHNFGGNLCVLNMKDGSVRELVPSLKEGIFGRFDLSFDAKKIVFDWKPSIERGFRIFEVGVDGSGLRQLTFEPADEDARIKKYDNSYRGGTGKRYNHHTDDMHPCYLPDGGIVFTSTRCEYGTLCDAPDILTSAILYRMDGDGGNMEMLTNSSVSEFSPSMMSDGRILYTRWEYVDKGQLGIKCLWAMRPDGSGSVEIYGNDIPFPPTLLHGRQIPGRENRFVVLGTPHYPQSGIGTVIRLDTTKDIRSREPMEYITPYVDVRQEPGWNQYRDGRWRRDEDGPLYMDPYPLSESEFLVAHNPLKRWRDVKAYGLYVLEEGGAHRLIYRDEEMSCWQPTLLKARQKPPVLARSRDEKLAKEGLAVCVVQDVYRGLEGIERGDVKYLRVMEQVPRPWAMRRFWDRDGEYGHHMLVSRGKNLGLKVMHGIVPVYEDGSAHFVVPADKNIYFQALDENYMEIQRERTYVNYKPGEVRSCVGCHERTSDVPAEARGKVVALGKAPSVPGAQPGDESAKRVLHYVSDVQPVLDKYCVRCHEGKGSKGGIELTGEMTRHFNRSYENLMRKGYVKTFDEGSDWGGSNYFGPKSVGSYASPLMSVIREGCPGNEEKLPLEAFVKIATWVDANGQYYGSYYGRKHIEFEGHKDFRRVPSFADAISREWPWD